MFKKIFKNMSQDNSEKVEKEITQEQVVNDDTTNTADAATEAGIGSAEELTEEEKLREDLAAEKDKFLRLFAEFENYKKRTSKERIDLIRQLTRMYYSLYCLCLTILTGHWHKLQKAKTTFFLKG